MTPIRPTGRDLSIKNTDDTYPLRWYPLSSPTPHTASETERDAMEWRLFAKTCQVMQALQYICPSAYKYAVGPSGIPTVTTRLGIGSQYEGQLQKPGGSVWVVPAKGRHYVVERSILEKFRSEAISTRNRAAAAAALSPDLKDLLDLNATCSGPAGFLLADVKQLKVDQVREDAFPLDTRKKQQPLNTQQQSLLRMTHEAHHAVSAWRKDPVNVPPPPPGIVQRCHDAFEASALDELQLHFFQIKPFSGVEHPGWTREELGLWAAIQDKYHHAWMDGMLTGDWAKVREADSAHLFAHLCMNFGPTCWQFLFPCGNGQKIDSCGKYLPKDALPVLRQRLGV